MRFNAAEVGLFYCCLCLLSNISVCLSTVLLSVSLCVCGWVLLSVPLPLCVGGCCSETPAVLTTVKIKVEIRKAKHQEYSLFLNRN